MTSRRKFCCNDSRKQFENYYLTQAGNGLPVFQGSRGQRGHGIGSVLGGLFRSALPVLKRIGGQLVRSGMGVASDSLEGQSFAESARKRASEGLKTLMNESNTIQQQGTGLNRRKRKIRRKKGKGGKKFRDIFA